MNHAAEERDIGTWTNRGVHIGLRGGTSKARVNNDPLLSFRPKSVVFI